MESDTALVRDTDRGSEDLSIRPGALPRPDFVILGAMKSGTTTLYEWLRRHPEIGMSREKETDFFIAEKNWGMGIDWYQGQFAPGRRIYGEASPNYTKEPAFSGVAQRIADHLPDARLIFIARDPVSRALSQYRHAQLAGAPVPPPDGLRGSHVLQHLIDTSSYARQLQPYLDRFPRDRFLFLEFEPFIADPRPGLTRLAEFLGVADDWPDASISANSTESLGSLPPWMFRLRRNKMVQRLNSALSPEMRSRLKSVVSRGRPARNALPPDAALVAEMADLLRPEADSFRRISGLPCANWSV